jgi:phosphoserine phosphatase
MTLFEIEVCRMKYVLTLIGNKEMPLTSAVVETARTHVPMPGTLDWLAEDLACDIPFEAPTADDAGSAESEVREFLSGLKMVTGQPGYDVAAQPAEGRRKKLLIADMDSTIIEQECIDELAAELGIKPQIAEITERAMNGEIGFEPALRERVGLLKGLGVASLEKVYRERITEMPGGRVLTATMRAHGATCALVSGGFTFFTARVAKAVGFDVNQANELLFENDALTGIVQEPILGKQAKLDALLALRAQHGLEKHETLAVGDGANDLAMIEEAGLGVAYHAKPVVAQAAGARIDHGDLTALLYLQGYRREEISG